MKTSFCPRLRKLVSRCVIAAALLGAMASSFAAATPQPMASIPWPDSPFTLINSGQKAEKMLTSFTQAFGLRLQLDDPLPEEAAPVLGRMTAANPTEFLNQLAATYGLMWYHYSGTLHVARAASRQARVLSNKGLSAQTLRRVMAEMGLLEAKFGWSEIEENGFIMVSGPKSYVERIEAAINALPEQRPEQQIQVYRLRYAAVDDRVISYRDKQISTPGVATVLRNLIAGGATVGASTEIVELAAPLRTEAKAASDTAGESTRPEPRRSAAFAGTGGTRTGPVIQADPRLNAIIVKDKPQNAPIYQALINFLDVPSSLIEIEAMIVDVNSENISELGIDWSAGIGKLAASSERGLITLAGGSVPSGTTAITNTANFILASIRAMESKGTARVVSRPSILTQDNMGALIDLADTFYIQTTGERVAQVTPVTVGVTLRVTPRVIGSADKHTVQLVVDIEDGGIQDLKIGNLPTVRRSNISTQALVGEAQSLVIGGLNTEFKSQNRDAVPVLGNVPVLGALFGHSTATNRKQERLFLITPRVIVAEDSRPAATRKNASPADEVLTQEMQ
ncbi:Outer membrane protein SpiA [Variovorax sp. PBS-H4]|uniref:type III secretion system outer membrane ring subunit SctC n=1 Tax=Variovorax sp. PBS-H4 TaxID=434008 RepID=UPI0013160E6C|nr:type III secretion system outer membrane ring subunit SctC [Variovorax sp. PBS-H4]VTU27159.1 Outer membrane protein SpiA [Variovorax sp. PBS-H4]